MFLNDTVLLAANTARTNAYAQALAYTGFKLKEAILYEKTSTLKAGQMASASNSHWHESPVYLPNLSVPVVCSLDRICEKVTIVKADSVNHKAVIDALRMVPAGLVIYSGYGSQIVGKQVLELCPQLLHIHSGWLPEFRGSTTLYYHLLESKHCGVSAILLGKGIDTGPIIARKKYPKPPAGLDIDYLYDAAIRADLLVDVLTHYHDKATMPFEREQLLDEGNTYYIIHPVLKHVALMSLK